MPKLVLHYFTFKGLAEGARMLMTYGGEEFEDHRINRETEWAAIKPTTPFGKLPILEIDGKEFSQSYAISRYLGHKYHLAGDTLEEALEIDQNMELYREIWFKAVELVYEKDQDLKAKFQAEWEKNFYPEKLKNLDEVVASNNGHIALGKLTWGDFFIAGMHEENVLILKMPDLYEKYPNLKRIYEHVSAIPKLKAYFDSTSK